MTSRARRQDGFSLPEIMVALLIVSMIAVSGAAILRSTLDASARLKDSDARISELQQARAILRQDFLQLIDRPVRDEFGQWQPFAFRGGDDPRSARVALTRAGWENPDGAIARSDLQYVEYWLEGDALVRRARSRLNATPETPVIERTLVSGVEALTIEYGYGDSWSTEWLWGVGGQTQSQSRPSAPPIVSMTFRLEDLGNVQILLLGGGGRQ